MSGHVQQDSRFSQAGYAMAGLLVGIAVMSILMSMLLPVWSHAAKREREAELIFRGEQYVRAIELYQRQYVGAYPPDLETLVDQRFLRRLYEDPMREDGEFRPVYQSQLADLQGDPATAERPGENTATPSTELRGRRELSTEREEGGIVGVVSTSEDESIRTYNGRRKYNEWAFVYTAGATQPGVAAGAGGPAPSRRGADGRPTGEDRGRFDLRSETRGSPQDAPSRGPTASGR